MVNTYICLLTQLLHLGTKAINITTIKPQTKPQDNLQPARNEGEKELRFAYLCMAEGNSTRIADIVKNSSSYFLLISAFHSNIHIHRIYRGFSVDGCPTEATK